MKLKGAQVLLECLREQGVDVIFGYPGGQVLPIYDALYDADHIKHIITAHEQGATHAADGYARATGKVGVVLATSGPGATNTVTGIATAFGDSVPMVVITGQVPCNLLGRSSFQEADIVSITKSITKKNFIVKEVEKLPEVVREAFELARTGRPGPVLIDITKDVQVASLEYEPVLIDNSYKAESSTEHDDKSKSKFNESLEEAIEAINSSKKPFIYAGGGVGISGATDELVRLSEKIKAPVTCTLMGLGAFPGEHPYFTGMVGMHGTRCSNTAINKCDLLIAIGARFSDRVTSDRESFASQAKIIHIDIDPNELGKNVNIDIPVNGDVKKVLSFLNENVIEKEESEWNEQIASLKENYPLKCTDYNAVNPKEVLETLYKLIGEKAVISTEVGQNQIWTAQFFKFNKPRTFITSGGLGTMGFGLGAAIGASIGRPDAKVINIAGDGSFKMNSIELATVSKYQIPMIQIVFNNHALGMVRQWQDLFYNKRFSQTHIGSEVDFINLAKAYGIKAIKISENQQIEPCIKEALEHDGPVFIEVEVHSDAKVFPIVPPGAPIDNIIESI